MRHFVWILGAGLLLGQAAYAQDGKQPKDIDKGKQPEVKLPPPTLVKPPTVTPLPPLPKPPAPPTFVPAPPTVVPPPPASSAAPGNSKSGAPTKALPRPYAHLDGKTIVFVANGTTDSTTLFDNLREAIEGAHADVLAVNVRWCRFNEAVKDHVDQEARHMAAYRLATTVLAIRRDAPAARIFFMGHSTGTHVVLMAAEMLPAASIEKIFLFASTVSREYVLQPALKTARGGIDNFVSRDDGILEHVEESAIGSADGPCGPTAGRFGFAVPRPPVAGKDKKLPPPHPDAALFASLHQVCWNGDMVGVGHGGHWTFIHECFLRRQIVPQLCW